MRGKPRKPGNGKRVAKRSVAGRTDPKSVGASAAPASQDFLLDENLTPAQLIFVEELCANPNRPAVHAARIAYPDQTPEAQRSTASENLTKPNIKAAIARRLAPLLHKTRTSREQVTKLIGEGMHWDPADIYSDDGAILPVTDWPVEARRQLASLEVDEITIGSGQARKVIGVTKKVRFIGRQEYISLGARMNKMLTDKVEHLGLDGIADRLLRAEERLAKKAS